jgi:hypothetical protein
MLFVKDAAMPQKAMISHGMTVGDFTRIYRLTVGYLCSEYEL